MADRDFLIYIFLLFIFFCILLFLFASLQGKLLAKKYHSTLLVTILHKKRGDTHTHTHTKGKKAVKRSITL